MGTPERIIERINKPDRLSERVLTVAQYPTHFSWDRGVTLPPAAEYRPEGTGEGASAYTFLAEGEGIPVRIVEERRRGQSITEQILVNEGGLARQYPDDRSHRDKLEAQGVFLKQALI